MRQDDGFLQPSPLLAEVKGLSFKTEGGVMRSKYRELSKRHFIFSWYEAALWAPTSVTNSHLSADPFKAGHLVPVVGWAVMNLGSNCSRARKSWRSSTCISLKNCFLFVFCFRQTETSFKRATWNKQSLQWISTCTWFLVTILMRRLLDRDADYCFPATTVEALSK